MATIGLGLGVLSSAFTVLNAYVFRPVDLPDPDALHSFTWDTESRKNHRFTLADVEAMREGAPLSGLAAAQQTIVMHDGSPQPGLLVTGNYFQLLGARASIRFVTLAHATRSTRPNAATINENSIKVGPVRVMRVAWSRMSAAGSLPRALTRRACTFPPS